MIIDKGYTTPKVKHEAKVLPYLYDESSDTNEPTSNRIVERIRRRMDDADKRRLHETKDHPS